MFCYKPQSLTSNTKLVRRIYKLLNSFLLIMLDRFTWSSLISKLHFYDLSVQTKINIETELLREESFMVVSGLVLGRRIQLSIVKILHHHLLPRPPSLKPWIFHLELVVTHKESWKAWAGRRSVITLSFPLFWTRLNDSSLSFWAHIGVFGINFHMTKMIFKIPILLKCWNWFSDNFGITPTKSLTFFIFLNNKLIILTKYRKFWNLLITRLINKFLSLPIKCLI